MKDKTLSPVSNSPWTVHWTEEDAEALREFIYDSKTGEKLCFILRSEAFGSQSADFINGTENVIQRMRQLPYAPIVDYVPQREDDTEQQEKHDPDNISF